MEYTIFDTTWGAFGVVARDRRLRATFLPQAEANVRGKIERLYPDAVEVGNLLPRLRKQIVDYFTGQQTAFTATVDLSGLPAFQRAVLEACRRIAYGHTTTYGDLAGEVGRPGAARAVGGAMARNPIPLVIPCHRVLCVDGSLGGFSSPGGTKVKEKMLRLERSLEPTPRRATRKAGRQLVGV